ncbi:MAG: glycosyltransferase family 9 protein [Crocinitomicaceae bacterium]|nr:glycosyltransferase family 9 protein [Crocinitomicaceae bacterium]
MNKILIIQTAFLGDVILATPVVSELKRLYPNSSVDVLVKKGNESLLTASPYLRNIHVFDKKNGKWKNILKLIRTFRKERYDLVINLHRFASSGIIAGLSKGKKKLGFKKNPLSFLNNSSFPHKIGDGTHEVERNLSLIESFGAKKLVRPTLFPSLSDLKKVEIYNTGNYICMAPASVWFTKQLPKKKWIELSKTIPSNTSIYLLGAPGDYDLCDEIRKSINRKNITNLAGKLSLLQSAALMKTAQRNYVNDSGPLHLASSVNAPVTAFFCSTIPDFGFGPLSEDSEIKQISTLSCKPCGLHGHKSCPEGHFKCGEILF